MNCFRQLTQHNSLFTQQCRHHHFPPGREESILELEKDLVLHFHQCPVEFERIGQSGR